MNVNMLTIDSNLAALTEASPAPSKSDSNTKGARFALTLDDEKPQVNTPEKPATDNDGGEKARVKIPERPATDDDGGEKARVKILEKPATDGTKEKDYRAKKPVGDSPEEFTESIDNKIKSDKDLNKSRKSKLSLLLGKNDAGTAKFVRPNTDNKPGQPHGISPTLTDTIHWLKGTEANPIPQLTQISNNTQGKSASVTGEAVKSTEIKLLHVTEKGQLGTKTILPAKSNGQNGLKAITPALTKSIAAVNKQPETQGNNKKAAVWAKAIGLTEKGKTRESAPETSVNSSKSTNAPGLKPSVMNANLTTVQDKTTETKPHSGRIEPEKLKLTADADVKTKKSQNISNLSNPTSKQSVPAGNAISQSKSVQKLDAASVQVAAGQTKDQGNSASNKSFSQGFEQMLSHNNSQTLITEQTSVPAKNSATANPQHSSQNNASADIGRQILESVQSSMSRQSAEHQITVRLNPPELGKVLIRFQQQENELTGLMEVNKSQTRFEIEQALPQIIRNLADCGIHIRRLEVTLSNDQQPGQGTLGNQSLQNGTAQQQHSANQGPSGNDSALSQSNEWLSSNNSYENLSELQEALITNGSINLLI